MSTSVKDVSAVMSSYVSNVGNTVNTGSKASFQEVWNKQTDKNSTSEEAVSPNRKVSEDMNAARRESAMKAKDGTRISEKEDGEVTQAVSMDEKKLEEAMELLNAAAMELMQEIADTFGISMEELEQLMADMELQPADLMNPEQLGALLLEAGGASDSLALLTDENLCASYQEIMNRQKEMLAALSETLQMSREQLTQLVEEMDAYTPETIAVEDGGIQITVEVENESPVNGEGEAVDGDSFMKEVNVAVEETKLQAEEQSPDRTSQNGAGEQQSDGARQQTGNLLLQNLKNEAFHPQLQQVAETPSAWNETTQNIMRQIMDFMRIQVKADTSSLEMQLHPASLGSLQVRVASEGGVLTANFVAENDTVKAVLESQMVQLKESFAEQGVKVEAIEVTVQTHQFESNLEQGRERQTDEPQKRNRTRRINLSNISLDMDELEDMTQEEQLAAEMMTANGNTVDYTA